MGTAAGNTKYIETPEKLWELFETYKNEVKNKPREVEDYVGKDAYRVVRHIERPLTVEGFKVFCANTISDIQAYWINRDNNYDDYSPIITRIKDEIRADQIEGGLLNCYNPNLTARINGIKDVTETTTNHNVQLISFDPLADELPPPEKKPEKKRKVITIKAKE